MQKNGPSDEDAKYDADDVALVARMIRHQQDDIDGSESGWVSGRK
jgi:hypothetical protein